MPFQRAAADMKTHTHGELAACSAWLQHTFLFSPPVCPAAALCAKHSLAWNLNCLQRKLFNIRPTHQPPTPTPPDTHTHTPQSPPSVHRANDACLFTLEKPVVSLAIFLVWSHHMLLLVSTIISPIHLGNKIYIAADQDRDKGFMSFYWCLIHHACPTIRCVIGIFFFTGPTRCLWLNNSATPPPPRL